MSLKVGDKVIVIAGKDKGKEGKVLAKKNDRVFVEGINMVKKHVKPNGQDQTGGIIDKEASIHISNVKVLDSKAGKNTGKAKEEKTEKKEVKKTKKETEKKSSKSKSKLD